MRRIGLKLSIEPMWLKMGSMVAALFFIYVADAILSYWVPGFLEGFLGTGLLMGLVMGFSSMVGLGVDFMLPQIFPRLKVTVLYLGAVVMSAAFAISLLGALEWPKLAVLLVGMALWGIYYELLLFGNQQFVAETVGLAQRSLAWAILRTFTSLAYVVGPVVAAYLLGFSPKVMLGVAVGLVIAGSVMMVAGSRRRGVLEVDRELGEISLRRELSHWWVLAEHVWPVLAMGVMLSLVDATFWTVGAVFSAKLVASNPWGGLWLSAYMAPSLLMGAVVAKWRIYKRKKTWATYLLILSGGTLSLLLFSPSFWVSLGIVFASSCASALALPLIDAVYTDLVARMGQERKHLIGLSSAMSSIAYVVGPIIAGALSDLLGEMETFAVMGIAMVLVGLVLLVTMPKKLRLPQAEMAKWV